MYCTIYVQRKKQKTFSYKTKPKFYKLHNFNKHYQNKIK